MIGCLAELTRGREGGLYTFPEMFQVHRMIGHAASIWQPNTLGARTFVLIRLLVGPYLSAEYHATSHMSPISIICWMPMYSSVPCSLLHSLLILHALFSKAVQSCILLCFRWWHRWRSLLTNGKKTVFASPRSRQLHIGFWQVLFSCWLNIQDGSRHESLIYTFFLLSHFILIVHSNFNRSALIT